MPSLKQGTLSFASAKRTSSISSGKPQKKTCATEKAKNKPVGSLAGSKGDAEVSEVYDISSYEDGAVAAQVSVLAKRTRSGTKGRPSAVTVKQAPARPSHSEKQEPSVAEEKRQNLDVEDKAGHYHRYYNEVRSKMGHLSPIHSEGQNKIHQMLRFFDMSYEFGPCIGMTRLERWERAEALGLRPPPEVRDILITKEGKLEYAQCVLDIEV